jgi:hypothetical protein
MNKTKQTTTESVTPHPARTTKKLTQTETMKESIEKIVKLHKRYMRNPEGIPYFEDDATNQKRLLILMKGLIMIVAW